MIRDSKFRRSALLALASVALVVLASACGGGDTTEPEPVTPDPVVTDPMPEPNPEPAPMTDPEPEPAPVVTGPVGLNARLNAAGIAEDGTALLTLALAESLDEDVVVSVSGTAGITFDGDARSVTIPAGTTVAFLEIEGVEIEDDAVEGVDAEITLSVAGDAVRLNNSTLSLRVVNPNEVVFGTPEVTNDGELTAVLSATLARASSEDVSVEVSVDEAVFGVPTVVIVIAAGSLTGELTLTATGEVDSGAELVFTPNLSVVSIAYDLDGTALTVEAPSAPVVSGPSPPPESPSPPPPSPGPVDVFVTATEGQGTVRAADVALVPAEELDPMPACTPQQDILMNAEPTHYVRYELSRSTVPGGISTLLEFEVVSGPTIESDTALTLKVNDPENALLTRTAGEDNGMATFNVALLGGESETSFTLLPVGSGTLNDSSKISLCLEADDQSGNDGGPIFAPAEGKEHEILTVLDPLVGTIRATLSYPETTAQQTLRVTEGVQETVTVTVRLNAGLDAELDLQILLDDPDDVIAAAPGITDLSDLKVVELVLSAGVREISYPLGIVDDEQPNPGGTVEVSLNASGYSSSPDQNAVLTVERDPDDRGVYLTVEPSVVHAGEPFTLTARIYHDQGSPVQGSAPGPVVDYDISGEGNQHIDRLVVNTEVRLFTDEDQGGTKGLPVDRLQTPFPSDDMNILMARTSANEMFEGARVATFTPRGFSDLRGTTTNAFGFPHTFPGMNVGFGVEAVYPKELTLTILPPAAGEVEAEMAMGANVGMERAAAGRTEVAAVAGQILVSTDFDIVGDVSAVFDYAGANALDVVAYDAEIGVLQLELSAEATRTLATHIAALREIEGVFGAGLNSVVQGSELDVNEDLFNHEPVGIAWAYDLDLHNVQSTLDAFDFAVPVTVAVIDNFVFETSTGVSHGAAATSFIELASLGRANVRAVQIEGAEGDNAAVSSIIKAIKETVDDYDFPRPGHMVEELLILNVPYAPPADCSLPVHERIEQMWDYREALTPVLRYAHRRGVVTFLPAGNDCVGHLNVDGRNTQHIDNAYKTRLHLDAAYEIDDTIAPNDPQAHAVDQMGDWAISYYNSPWDTGGVFLVGALGADGDRFNRQVDFNRVAPFSRVHLRDVHTDFHYGGAAVDLYMPGRLLGSDFYQNQGPYFSGTSWASAIAAGQAALFAGLRGDLPTAAVLRDVYQRRYWIEGESNANEGLLINFSDQFLAEFREHGGGGDGFLPSQFGGFSRTSQSYTIGEEFDIKDWDAVLGLLDPFFEGHFLPSNDAQRRHLEEVVGIGLDDRRIADYWDVRQYVEQGGDALELFTRLGVPISDASFRTEYPILVTYGGEDKGSYRQWYDNEEFEHRFGVVLYRGYRGHEYGLLDSHQIFHGPGFNETLYTLGVVRLPLEYTGPVLATHRKLPIRADVTLTTGDDFFGEILVENSGDVGFYVEVESPAAVQETITVRFDAAPHFVHGGDSLPLATDDQLPVEVTLLPGETYGQSEYIRVAHLDIASEELAFQYGNSFSGRHGTTVTLFDEASPGWGRPLLLSPTVVSGNPDCCDFRDDRGNDLPISVVYVDNDAPLTLNYNNREGIALAPQSEITLGQSQAVTLEVPRRAASHALVDWSDLESDGRPKELTHLEVEFLNEDGSVHYTSMRSEREAGSDAGPWSFDILRDVAAVPDEVAPGVYGTRTTEFFEPLSDLLGLYTLNFKWYTSMDDSTAVELPDDCCHFVDNEGVSFGDDPRAVVAYGNPNGHLGRSLAVSLRSRYRVVEGETLTVLLEAASRDAGQALFAGRLEGGDTVTELTGLEIIDRNGYLETATVPAWDGTGRIHVDLAVKPDLVDNGEELASQLQFNFEGTNWMPDMLGNRTHVYGWHQFAVVDADTITVRALIGDDSRCDESSRFSACTPAFGVPFFPRNEVVVSEWEEFTALVTIDRAPSGQQVLLEYTGDAELTALDGGPPIVIFETATNHEVIEYFGVARLRLTHAETEAVLTTDREARVLNGELRIAPNQPGVQEQEVGFFRFSPYSHLPYTTLRVRKEIEVLTYDLGVGETVTTVHGRNSANPFRKGISVTGVGSQGSESNMPGRYGTVCVEVRSDEEVPRLLRSNGLISQDGYLVVDTDDAVNRMSATSANAADGFRFCALLETGKDYYLDVEPVFELSRFELDGEGEAADATVDPDVLAGDRFRALGDYTVSFGPPPEGFEAKLQMREPPMRGVNGNRQGILE